MELTRLDFPKRSLNRTTMSTQGWIDWCLGSLLEAAYGESDPLSSEEIQRLLQPISQAGGKINFESWVRRRLRTLRFAIAADRALQDRPVPLEWLRCYEELDGNGIDLVILLLLDEALSAI